jgi:hypothetical protein
VKRAVNIFHLSAEIFKNEKQPHLSSLSLSLEAGRVIVGQFLFYLNNLAHLK